MLRHDSEPFLRNSKATQVLADVNAELWRIAEQWRDDASQQEAIAGVGVVRRVLEAVREAVRLRPDGNEVSQVTLTTIDAAALGLDQAADAAKARDLELALREMAATLRIAFGIVR